MRHGVCLEPRLPASLEELTADEICDRLEALVPSFQHPYSGQATHLVVTGGEPMLSQTALVAVLDALAARDNLPNFITIETNGTQAPRPRLGRSNQPL